MPDQKKRTFRRVVLRYEVLMEGDVELSSLAEIAVACDTGPCVGRFLDDESNEELTGKQMADALYEAGSEPGFYELTDEGESAWADVVDGLLDDGTATT